MSESTSFLSIDDRAALEEYVLRHERRSGAGKLAGMPVLHSNQKLVARDKSRYKVLMCGRRFGKTLYATWLASQLACRGKRVGWFAPNYTYVDEPWRELKKILSTVLVKSMEVGHRIEVTGGGSIEMWTCDGVGPGRGRHYDYVIIDEAGLIADLETIWSFDIMATLADTNGKALFAGTPKGVGRFSQLYALGQDACNSEWQSWRFSTWDNPYIPADWIEAARNEMPERAFRQEIQAEVIADAGGVFRNVEQCIIAGHESNEEPSFERIYTMGVDLARVHDFTVVTVLDDAGRQVFFDRFNQISWDRQISTVVAAAKRYNAKVLVDSTGAGEPVYESLMKSGIFCQPIKFNNQNKNQMMDRLAMGLERGDYALMDLPVQTTELQSYEYNMTQHGNVQMSAPSGGFDDCCVALALAAWGMQDSCDISGLITAGMVRDSTKAIW